MKYRISEILYSCEIDDETGRASYCEWGIRSICGGKVHAILRDEFTRVKLRRGKDQMRGWAKYIPACCRETRAIGVAFNFLFRTKEQALKYARKRRLAREKRLAHYSQKEGAAE